MVGIALNLRRPRLLYFDDINQIPVEQVELG